VLSGFFATYGIVDERMVTADMRRTVRDALERMEASHLAHKALDEMSTGEARRVLIARALVTAPVALVLDEPTTGLDMVARQRFLEMVSRVAQGGTTIILVTHHVEEIIPEIEYVVLLKQGGVAFSGHKRDVLTSAHLTSVYGASISLQEADGYYHAFA
jgi:iron complex transport system ATP-binding protein